MVFSTDKFDNNIKNQLPNALANTPDVTNRFTGPSLYFHYKAVSLSYSHFLSTEHLETVYATLVAWGMHRMGSSGAKMPDFDDFEASIYRRQDTFNKYRGIHIESIPDNQFKAVLSDLTELCFSINATTTNSHLVSGTKTLAHILPDLVPPMDNQYTRQMFCKSTLSGSEERVFFENVMTLMYNFYKDPSVLNQCKPMLNTPFNDSLPKLFDNLIIMNK